MTRSSRVVEGPLRASTRATGGSCHGGPGRRSRVRSGPRRVGGDTHADRGMYQTGATTHPGGRSRPAQTECGDRHVKGLPGEGCSHVPDARVEGDRELGTEVRQGVVERLRPGEEPLERWDGGSPPGARTATPRGARPGRGLGATGDAGEAWVRASRRHFAKFVWMVDLVDIGGGRPPSTALRRAPAARPGRADRGPFGAADGGQPPAPRAARPPLVLLPGSTRRRSSSLEDVFLRGMATCHSTARGRGDRLPLAHPGRLRWDRLDHHLSGVTSTSSASGRGRLARGTTRRGRRRSNRG
jgi:hypothetical protein